MRRFLPILIRVVGLLLVCGRLDAADSLSITFRYADTSGSVVRAFVPGEFNNWGPNTNGVITEGAPSQMTSSGAGSYFYKSVRLAVGTSYAYKFYLQNDQAGTVSRWIPDPLNPSTDGSQYGNSLVTTSGFMLFETEFGKNSAGDVDHVRSGVFSTALVTCVLIVVDNDSTQITSSLDPSTGILDYSPSSPIAPGHTVRLVAEDALGRTVAAALVTPTASSRKLDVTFLFHANQNLVPYGRVADRACFRGLIQTLRNHPSMKFQLHFSAPLIHDLQWFGDSTLQLIREGIRDSQFEIFGSTYAQNIMYSTRSDTGDYEFNNHQIMFQKELTQKVLGVTPRAFWNAERVWTQNFVQLLADNGYRYVPVEDHILLASGATGPVYQPRVTRYNGRQVVAFEDDKTFLGLVDAAINSGNPAPVITYLNNRYVEDTLDQDVIGYYQDAEATGLWDYEGGINPQTNFDGLNALLNAVANDTLINVTTYEDWLASNPQPPELTPIVDGAAQWMGGDAWFTENQNPAFQSMRGVYDSLRTYIDSVATVVQTFAADTAADKLIRHAWFTLCAHQFEFGCHGLEGDVNHTQLQLARASAVSATAALHKLLPQTGSTMMDINRDGVNEVVLTTPRDLFVFSTSGGRLLYWFDLQKGEEIVGNENFSADYGENYVNDNFALPLIRGGQETYHWLWGNPLIPEVFTWNFTVRKRALNDQMSVNGRALSSLENVAYTANLDSTGVTFSLASNGMQIRKTLTATDDGLQVAYQLRSMLPATAQVDFEVQNSFSPSTLAVMDNGRSSLGYWDGAETVSPAISSSSIGVKNTVTGSYVRYQWSPLPDAVAGKEDVFGLEMNPSYLPTLAAGDSVQFGFLLQNRTVTTGVSGPGLTDRPSEWRLDQNYPNPFNPSTVISGQLTVDSRMRLAVYDVLGRQIAVLAEGRYPAGAFSFTFDGSRLTSGVYFYRLEAGGKTLVRKMTLLR